MFLSFLTLFSDEDKYDFATVSTSVSQTVPTNAITVAFHNCQYRRKLELFEDALKYCFAKMIT